MIYEKKGLHDEDSLSGESGELAPLIPGWGASTKEQLCRTSVRHFLLPPTWQAYSLNFVQSLSLASGCKSVCRIPGNKKFFRQSRKHLNH